MINKQKNMITKISKENALQQELLQKSKINKRSNLIGQFFILTLINVFAYYYNLIKMKNQAPVGLARLYREFSRQKFSKYKHKYPRLKESQITKKILKQWQALDDKAKQGLQQYYEKKNFFATEDASEEILVYQKEKEKPKKKNEKQKVKIDKPQKVIAPIKVVQDEPIVKPQEESSANIFEQQLKIKSDSDSEKQIQIQKPQRSKKIKKPIQNLQNAEYLQFFKFYYERLAKQHPRWNSKQLSTIIKLLWKKRLIAKKKETEKHHGPRKLKISKIFKLRRLNPYKYFQKCYIEKNPSVDKKALLKQTLPIWKKFTRQGKRYFAQQCEKYNLNIKGNDQPIKQAKEQLPNQFFIENLNPKKPKKEIKNNINFLNKMIELQ